MGLFKLEANKYDIYTHPLFVSRNWNYSQEVEICDSMTVSELLQTVGLVHHTHSCETAIRHYPHATGFNAPNGPSQGTQQVHPIMSLF